MSASAANPRRAILARVHIAKKEMRLEDAAYRDVLLRMTGKDSSAECSDQQLSVLLDEFRRLGWKPRSGKAPSANPQVRIIYAIWKDVKKLLAGDASTAQLRAFVRRQTVDDRHPEGVSAPEFCDHAQAVKVIEGLKGWRDRLIKKGGTDAV